ncbi:hypothetical protein LXL04_034426 [Taraxacum kok-saghyz]
MLIPYHQPFLCSDDRYGMQHDTAHSTYIECLVCLAKLSYGLSELLADYRWNDEVAKACTTLKATLSIGFSRISTTVQMRTIIEFENAKTNMGHLFFMLKNIIYNHI